MAPSPAPASADARVTTLDNGVRVLVLPEPRLATAAVSVFVRSGSQHESAHLNGISHCIEHMAFKGTRTRSCQQINLDAERLGAEVDAHTDKDHTAYHMRGHARDAAAFVRMLGDIVTQSDFPAAELDRERAVLLQEYTEDEDDDLATAFKLFDVACFGVHPVARPVIGTRANLRRFTREELLAHVARQYTGANTIVGVAGNVDPAAMLEAAAAAFGGMTPGRDNRVDPPAYVGGVRTHRLRGSPQAHLVLGFPVPPLPEDHAAFVVAASLFGDGMSSPLLDQLRERRAAVYHAHCSADVRDTFGQFIVEASTMPEHVAQNFDDVFRLLLEQRESTDAVGLERARNQVAVRILHDQESPGQRLEQAALDLFALGRVRPARERLASIAAVGADEVRAAFGRMQDAGAAVALVGRFTRGDEQRAESLAARRGRTG